VAVRESVRSPQVRAFVRSVNVTDGKISYHCEAGSLASDQSLPASRVGRIPHVLILRSTSEHSNIRFGLLRRGARIRMQRNQWLVLATGALLAACGVGSNPKPERLQEERALLALPPQISPDFAVGDAVADFDRN